MPVKTPLKGVTIQRVVDGVRRNLHPPIGKPFDFTDQEIRQITAAQDQGAHRIHHIFEEDDPDQPKVAARTAEQLADSPDTSSPLVSAEDHEAADQAKADREAETLANSKTSNPRTPGKPTRDGKGKIIPGVADEVDDGL